MTTQYQQVLDTLKDIKDAQKTILESLNGNGKPGLKTEVATVQGCISHLQKDVDGIKHERTEEAQERIKDFKERDAERRKFYYTIAGLFLGEAVTLLVAIFVK